MAKMGSDECREFDAKLAPRQAISLVKRRENVPLKNPLRIVPTTACTRPKQPINADTAHANTLHSFIDKRAFRQHYQTDSTILLHGDAVDAVYLIESGTVRCSTTDAFGCRQIFSFLGKGGIVGISDTDRWHFTAEAVDHVILKSIPRAILEQELAVNVGLRQEVRAYMRALLVDRERQLLTLVSAKGPQRLYQFLEAFGGTRAKEGFVVLPMSRRDIGDHIGLSTESVSRAFSHLKRLGIIDLKGSEKYRIVGKPLIEPGLAPQPSHA